MTSDITSVRLTAYGHRLTPSPDPRDHEGDNVWVRYEGGDYFPMLKYYWNSLPLDRDERQ